MIAVIAGATGLVGSILVKKLLADDEVTQVISVSRRSLQIDHPKLKEVLISDLSGLAGLRAELRGDVYFCCLGTTIKAAGSRENFRKVDLDGVVEFGKIAKANDARAFVVITANGADSRSRIFYNRVKGEAEEALEKLQLNRLVIFRPSLLIGDRKAFRLGEKIAVETLKRVSGIVPQSLKKRVMTDVSDLAESMLDQGESLRTDRLVKVEAREI